MQTRRGFTLIELIVVLVILGILAAFAVPRFVDLQQEARTSTLRGLEGSIRGAASLAHGKVLANSTYTAGSDLNFQGNTIAMEGTWPAATSEGIPDMIQDLSGFNHDGCGSFTDINTAFTGGNCYAFVPNGAANQGECYVAYGINGTGSKVYPVYDTNSSDCG